MAKTSGRKLAQVIQEEILPEYYDMDMVTQGQMRWALNAAAFDMEGHSFPEGMRDTLGCEGVDPDGMYCKENMDYVHRAQQVQIRAKMGNADPSVQYYLRSIVGEDGEIELPEHEIEASENKRLYTRAAKRAGTQEAKDVLAAAAEAEGKELFQERNLYLETMEYAVGLRKEPLTDAHREMLRMRQGSQVVNRLDQMAENSDTHIPQDYGDTLTVKFANFDNILRQRFLAHPSNYSKSIQHAPNDYKTPAIAEADTATYIQASMAPTMDAMFQGVEKKWNSGDQPKGINRGNLIVVDGKTVAERMQEIYTVKGGTKDGYAAWYGENMNQMTNEIVGAALTAGKKVCALSTDQNGKVNSEPTPIHREGYEPTPLKPVSMRGWHRMWNRVGLYKDRKMAHDAYLADQLEQDGMNAAVARAKAVNTLSVIQSLEAGNVTEQFYPETPAPRGTDMGLKVGRTSHHTGARSILLSKGYAIDDVFNHDMLKEEKVEAGREYLEMVDNPTDENRLKIGGIYGQAMMKVTAYMDNIYRNCSGAETVNHPDLARNLEISGFSFDMSQNTGEHKNYMRGFVEANRPSENEPYTDQQVNDIFNEIQTKPHAIQVMHNQLKLYHTAMANLGTDETDLERAMISSTLMGDQINLIDDRQAKNPGKSMFECVTTGELESIAAESIFLTPIIKCDSMTATERATAARNLAMGRCDFGSVMTEPISAEDLTPRQRGDEGYNRSNKAKSAIQATLDKAAGRGAPEASNKKSNAPARREVKLEDLMPSKKETTKRQVKKPESPQRTAQKGGPGK